MFLNGGTAPTTITTFSRSALDTRTLSVLLCAIRFLYAQVFNDFGEISGPHFPELFGHCGLKFMFFFMLVSMSLFVQIFESESGRLALPKQAFGVRLVQKPNFRRSRNSHEIRKYFWCISEAVGVVFLIVGALETDLNIDGFSGGWRIQSTTGGGGNQGRIGCI